MYHLYGDPTPEQQLKADEWLKGYIREGERYIPRADIEDFLTSVFGVEIPVLKTFAVHLRAVQPKSGIVHVKCFDEDEAHDMARDNYEDADWDNDGELTVGIESITEV